MTRRATSSTAVGEPVGFRSLVLAVTRMAIGWHFLYEGIVKLLEPGWTAAGYLKAATGPAAGLFHWLAGNEAVLSVVDLLNAWGLVLIGACLMLGLLTRFAAACGVLLLLLYYAAHPPLFGEAVPGTTEGHYLLVNKNLVELLALAVVVVYPARDLGFDAILFGWRRKRKQAPAEATSRVDDVDLGTPETTGRLSRRQLLAGLSGVPAVGALGVAAVAKHGWPSHEEKQLAKELQEGAAADVDAISMPTKTYEGWASLEDLKGKVPTGRIGDLEISRVILGGNLIGGWAHARDLIYASDLIKAYHTRDKIAETLRLAEACGINTLSTNTGLCDVVSDYWKNGGGKIQFICDLGGKGTWAERVQKSIDTGASACYIHGGIADRMVDAGDFDTIAEVLEMVRKHGVPAGIGGHKLSTIRGCVEKGLKPDFWMKTLHQHDYFSARPDLPDSGFRAHDNNWCPDPDETVAFMEEREEPWIAFKVLAAGAIQPKIGFKYAFESGADFVCVGMYDFQIVDDINIACDALSGDIPRTRPWCG